MAPHPPPSPPPPPPRPSPDADGATDDGPAERRLQRLEERLSFVDDLVEHLNRQVATQQQQIELLARELSRLRHQQADAGEAGSAPRNLRDELPPHY